MPTFHSLRISVELSVPNFHQAFTASTSTRQARATSSAGGRLENLFWASGTNYVLPEELLSKGECVEFIGEHKNIPFYLVRAGKDIFKAKHETGRGGGFAARKQLLLVQARSPPSPEQTDSATGREDIQELVTTLAPSSEPVTEGQKADSGDRLSPATRRSSFGRLLKRKGSPSSFSMRSSLSQLKSTTANSTPTNTTSVAPTNSASPRTTTPMPSAKNSVLSRTATPAVLAQNSVSSRITTPIPSAQASAHPKVTAATGTPVAPLPLTLTVTLNPPSWSDDPRKKTQSQDVKIDVFFNGEFAGSRIILARQRESGWGRVSETFSGRRIALRQERVWVLVPPGQNADGSLREPKRAKGMLHPTAERWAEIGRALREESGRWGRTNFGDRSCVGEYLQSLGKTVEMPAKLENMQKPGTQKFGVMDVVISMGKVGVRETSYLRAPQRSLDPRYPSFSEGSKEVRKNSENAPISQVKPTPSGPTPVKRKADMNPPLSGPTPVKRKVGRSDGVFDHTPPERRNILQSVSEPSRRSVGRFKAKVSLPKTTAPRSIPAVSPDPLRINNKISAEQRRRLLDLTPTPVRPRPESIPTPIDVPITMRFSHGLLNPNSASPTSIRPNSQSTSGESSSTPTKLTLQHTLGEGGGMDPQSRGRPGEVQGDSPAGKPTIVPEKRYRYADSQPRETPLKRRSRDNLSTTLNESMWRVDSNGSSSSRQIAPKTTEANPFATSKLGPSIPDPNSVPSRVSVAPDMPWRPGPLSEDAVLTYAEGNAWGNSADQRIQRVASDIPAKRGDVVYEGEDIGGVRSTRAERAAGFEEESVLMGVRYVVG
ncbi:MAG: hypothetical protein M1839_008830 [Geoglossum umbratile]|nr:MAG: hypothetical protein M1839_008830 [Geoglossum umbratile]